MKAVIIGAGNVATHFAKALQIAGVQVAQVWSNHYANAQVLAGEVGATAVQSLNAINNDTQLCIIAIKDDAISTIIPQLKGFNGIVVHTSGAVAINIFENQFANYGVFYPLQTFSKEKQVDFSTIPLCLEANNEATLKVLTDLATKLSGQVEVVNSEKRKILHLAAVFACNFTNHLYTLANELLTANDLDFQIIRPLINETASKVQHALPAAVQTGPAIRHDEETMKKHIALLQGQPELIEIYRTLSNSIKKTKL